MIESTEQSPPIESEDEAAIETKITLLRALHACLAVSPLVLGVVGMFVVRGMSKPPLDDWRIGLGILAVGAVFVFFSTFAHRKKALKEPGPPSKDPDAYMMWKLVSWVPFDMVAVLSVMMYIGTHHLIFLALAACLLVGLFFKRASREEFESFRANRPRN